MKSLTLLAISAVAAKASPTAEPIRPNHDSASANANRIFNAIHSAGRQWGSSLNHNGFGFIPVTLSAGALLYHGGYSKDPPEGLEWLAFEVEHAENFVRVPRHPPNPPKGPEHEGQPQAPSSPQKFLVQPETEDHRDRDSEGRIRGYLQTYQTTRDVQLLYIDGSGAAKSPIGTLDSQDHVLFPNSSWQWYNIQSEMQRATAMCDMITKWGWAGIMRMEIGFEVIWCDFKSDDLQHESSVRALIQEDRLKDDDFMSPYLWTRAVAERYDGLGGDRVKMDFSSMVSGFFFPINISHTDPERPDLIRLKAAKLKHRLDIRTYLQKVFEEPRRFNVNWQGIVDMIVTRFSKRLAAMASTNVSTDIFIGELEGAVLAYYEAPGLPDDVTLAEDEDNRNKTAEAIDRCATQYLKSSQSARKDWTLQDDLIHTALSDVMQHICNDLYVMRTVLLRAAPDTSTDAYFINKSIKSSDMEKAVNQSRAIVRSLVHELAWTTWRKPQLCAEDEILVTVMWPFGDTEDYYNPGCVSFHEITEQRRSYWRLYEKRPRDF
ncbi:uncharacterized protein TrAFT101_011020 [Trichoderma asperellum]|uniref:uncharacterized protein n=1 Tax=Trichoderma asperellum TaxID=101201 RepID=UPI00331AFE41|nr:hypothetical protein TrAFT101_011020 [Trichoderma asperellum]